MLTTLANICEAVEYVPETDPTNAMEFENINNVETISRNLYYIIQNIQYQANNNHWVGDEFYAGDPINAGGTYNG